MSDNLKEKVNAIGERLKIGGSVMSRKMSASMSSMSFKVKEFFQEPNQADKLVGDATSETLDEPNWDIILHVCDLVNGEKLSTCDVVRAIKKRVMVKSGSDRGVYLALVFLEALVKNCDKGFFEVASERVLDEMVKLVEDPQSGVLNRDKALMMIEDWGELNGELRYLPVYEETYKNLKSRGIRFPSRRDKEILAPIFTSPAAHSAYTSGEANVNLRHLIQHDTPYDLSFEHLIRCDIQSVPNPTPEQIKEAFDVARNSIEILYVVLSSSPQQDVLKDDLTNTLVQQCRQSQSTILRIIETVGDNEALLFEALHLNDEIQKVLSKYEELKKPTLELGQVMIPVVIDPNESSFHFTEDQGLIRKPAGSRIGDHQGLSHDDMIDDLDEMIFGKMGEDTSEWGHVPKKQQSPKHDLISF